MGWSWIEELCTIFNAQKLYLFLRRFCDFIFGSTFENFPKMIF